MIRMYKVLRAVAAAAASLLCAATAFAADMPVKALAPAVTDWTGLYAGGNIGYGWGENANPALSVVDPIASGVGPFLSPGGFSGHTGNLYPNLKPSGVFGGGQIGYDRQFGTRSGNWPNTGPTTWVAGIVADIQAAHFNAGSVVFTPTSTCCNVTESLSAKISWFGTVRGKLGFAANDWLFYGTGGLAYGRTSSELGFACTPGGVGCTNTTFAGSHSEIRTGFAAGAGIAKAIGRWSVGAEYLHIDLGRSSVTVPLVGFPTTTLTASQRFAVDALRLTLNHKLGEPAAPKW